MSHLSSVAQMTQLVSPSRPEFVSQMAVAPLVYRPRPVDCRPDGLSPRLLATPRDTWHVTRTPLSRSKGQGHQAALVGCTGRPTWTYSNGDLSICVHDVRILCHHLQAWAGHIVAAARLQLVFIMLQKSNKYLLYLQHGGAKRAESPKGVIVKCLQGVTRIFCCHTEGHFLKGSGPWSLNPPADELGYTHVRRVRLLTVDIGSSRQFADVQ